MKKLLVSLGLFLGVSLAGLAQSVYDNPDNKAGLGLRVSYELACPGDVSMNNMLKADIYGNGSGVSFGAVYNMPVFYNFYFEPGVMLAYNTYSLNKDAINAAFDSDPELAGLRATAASVRMWDLRIPLIGSFRFDVLDNLGVTLFTGPELSFGLSAKNHIKVGSLTVSEGAYGGDGELNRTDLKWRFGVGAVINKHFVASLSGAVGLLDRARDDYKMHSNLFDITLGYNF